MYLAPHQDVNHKMYIVRLYGMFDVRISKWWVRSVYSHFLHI